jgi:uncharacterized membrane protein SpoIIM required for sporulation/uncharacterized RDD family membrane protein YckC
MKRFIKIQTPEKVVLTYNIAPLPMRGLALFTDTIIRVGIFALFAYFISLIDATFNLNYMVFNQLIGLTYFVLFWFYMIILSYLFSGSTPGKMLTGLKVIKLNGEPLDFSTILIRNIARGIDSFPIINPIGYIIAQTNAKRRRLGDFAAGTVVVNHSRRCGKLNYENITPLDMDFRLYNLKDTNLLSEKDLYYLKLLLIKNSKDKAEYNLGSFAKKISTKINYTTQIDSPEEFLHAVYNHNTDNYRSLSEQFIESRIEDWNKLDLILKNLRLTGRIKGKYRESIIELPDLYRKVCADLSFARGQRLSPDITEYLNKLAGRSHMLLYSRQSTNTTFSYFINNFLVNTFIKNWKVIIVAFVLFFGSLTASLLYTMQDKENALFFLDQETLDYVEDMHSEGSFGETSASTRVGMAMHYISHNTKIAFITFAAGLLLGLGSIYFLVYNGIAIGSIIGYLIAAGYGANIGHFITAHSVFELTAIMLAGAAGMKVGFLFFKRAKFSFIDVLDREKENISSLITVFIIFLFFAAIIEGLVSPSGLPWIVKLLTAISSLAIICILFIILPLRRNKRGTLYD